MAVHPICLFPNPVLKKITKSVTHLTGFHHKVIKDLIDTLKVQPGGIGIAAPQIGYPERIAVIDASPKDKSKKRLILINPEIITGAGEAVGREGCMSVPNYTGNVKRVSWVRVRWKNQDFQDCEMETEGIEAICIQHEIDHLNGKLFLDRVSSLTKDIFRRKVYLKS